MYYLILFLFIFGWTSSIATNSSILTFDCWKLQEQDFIIEIWSSSLAGNPRSLTIQNCENVVLNISTSEEIKSSLRYLTVRNVKNCKITGNECSRTSLPSHSFFINLELMKMETPLYSDGKSTDGVLELTNVTIDRVKPGSVKTFKSFKKFAMRRVVVMIAERDAIAFEGSINSILEITDSTFHSLDENFIVCNVTSAIFQNNLFKVIKEGSFSIGTTTFSSLGNFANIIEDCAVRLYSKQSQIGNEPCGCKENDLFNRNICINLVADNWQETTPSTRESYLYEDSNEIIVISEIKSISDEKPSNFPTAADETNRREKVAIFLNRFGNRFFLLWFLTITLLVLMFPIAYFTKIFLCTIINKVFPLDMKHKMLVNEEDV